MQRKNYATPRVRVGESAKTGGSTRYATWSTAIWGPKKRADKPKRKGRRKPARGSSHLTPKSTKRSLIY
jgi:hypothetical protein